MENFNIFVFAQIVKFFVVVDFSSFWFYCDDRLTPYFWFFLKINYILFLQPLILKKDMENIEKHKIKKIAILMFCCKETKVRTTGCKYTGEGGWGGEGGGWL